jgi:double-stranded uracil-DNA glycosylase
VIARPAFLCMPRPSPEDLQRAGDRTIPDLVGPGLGVLFCGINPGLWSGASGLHFARPGNRFWKVLHGAGFTDRVLDPAEQAVLPSMGIGITNLVARTTAAASDLSGDELRAGAVALGRKVRRLGPGAVAFVGMQAYRTAFRRPRAPIGAQDERLAGSAVWVLPNPSGLQARYQLPDMVAAYSELRRACGIPAGGRRSPTG